MENGLWGFFPTVEKFEKNYIEWHTERAPQGKKVNSVEETSSLRDKIDAI